MSNPFANAAIKAGLIPLESLEEFKRWGAPIEIPTEIPSSPKSLEEAAETIRSVLESEGLIFTKETDLSVLSAYLNTQQSAMLHVESDLDVEATFSVIFGKTLLGEYILPYRGDDLRDLMTNGRSYLEETNKDSSRVYFKEVREVFFGEVKAFIVCTPSRKEAALPEQLEMAMEKTNG